MMDETSETAPTPTTTTTEKRQWPADPNYRLRQSGQSAPGPIGNPEDIPIIKRLAATKAQETPLSGGDQRTPSTDYRLRQSEQGQPGPIGNVEDIPIMQTATNSPEQQQAETAQPEPTQTTKPGT